MTDERDRAKEEILKRRAKLLLVAIASTGLNACGGKAEGANTGQNGGDGDGDGDQYVPPGYCLSVCLSMVCLSIPPCDTNNGRICQPPGTTGNPPCPSPCEYDETGQCVLFVEGGSNLGGGGGAAPSGGAPSEMCPTNVR